MAVADRNQLGNQVKVYMYLDNVLIYVFDAVFNGNVSLATLLDVSVTPIYKALNGGLFFKIFTLLSELDPNADN
jgi:hypothetical protein